MHCSRKPTLSSHDQFGANICVSLLGRRAISSQVPKWGKTGRFASGRSSTIRPPRGIARRISHVLARVIAVACSRPLSRTAVAALARPVLLPRRSCQHLHPVESVPSIDKLLGKPASPLAQEGQDHPFALSPRKTGQRSAFLRQPGRTIAAQNRPAASARTRLAADGDRPSGIAVAAVPPAAPTAPRPPFPPKNCRAASASSCRRIPQRQGSPAAASSHLSVSRTGQF